MYSSCETKLSLWQHGVIFSIALFLLASRRPDSILNAQFYAEDGRVFFQDAYNLGWSAALFQPYGGYFHAVPRLAAALALLAPLYLAPLVLNLVALGLQAIPANLLLSSRSASWGDFKTRLSMAGLYIAVPNCGEICANITNAQCSLSLIAFLILVAAPSESFWNGWFDILFLLLFGLSGPYCIFLFPIALALAWIRSNARQWVLLAVVAATSLVESWSLLFLDRGGRVHYILGASWVGLARILAEQIYLGALLGANRIGELQGAGTFAVLGIAIGGTAIIVICFRQTDTQMRALILFACIVLTASLVSPMILIAKGQTLWPVLAGASDEHYWFFPILAFVWSLLQCVRKRADSALRVACIYLLCLLSIGIVRDWKHPAFKDLHFAASARFFENAPAGTAANFAENPEGWNIRLVKH